MKKKSIIYFTGILLLFISCNLSDNGEITERRISNTPYPDSYGWSVSKGAKKYFLKNNSTSNIYTFTIKKTKYRNGEFKDRFDKYKLSPGEETEIGISMMQATQQPSDVDEIVKIEIVGKVKNN